MTKKLEETFNISGQDDNENEAEHETPSIEESNEISEILNTESKSKLLVGVGVDNPNIDRLVHAGAKILETANQLLKTAKEAKDSKVDRKLKMINLQLQKAKLDHQKDRDTSKDDNELESEGSLNLDRNELLKRIANAQKVADEVTGKKSEKNNKNDK